ncbi:MAG: chain-length determining protein [Prevotella sp.]|nr:chain-length determining protein [Prevotella sp.]
MENKLSIFDLYRDIYRNRRLYYKVIAVSFIIAAFITLCIPNYYRCTVKLAPELSGNSKTGSLASLASSFGINIASGNFGTDALIPTLYPDLINSVPFRASLFPVLVEQEDDSTHTKMSYYDYLSTVQKLPWWTSTKKAIIETVKSWFFDVDSSEFVNPFKLTKEQYNIAKEMEDKVVCDVDKKTLVITIDVTDTDPYIAATMADSVRVRLQKFITDYRTSKARIDLEYNKKLLVESEARYEKARKAYADYADANRSILFENLRSERTKLENKMQIEYRAYSQVLAQLQLAEAKVQEETPAFTILQPATVPVKKEGPRRAILCLMFLFLACMGTTIYVWHKEKHLLPIIGLDKKA